MKNKKGEKMRTIKQALNTREIDGLGLESLKLAVFFLLGFLALAIMCPPAHAATKTPALIPSINSVEAHGATKHGIKLDRITKAKHVKPAVNKTTKSMPPVIHSLKTNANKVPHKNRQQKVSVLPKPKKTATKIAKPTSFYLKQKHPIHFANKVKKHHVRKSTKHRKRARSHGIRHSARIISFKDNDQISVVLSRVDTNRIEVKGDKITAVNGPTGEYAAKNDASGAAYISVYKQLPFTVFLTTEAGHSLSLFVVPKNVVGKTLILKARSASKEAIAKEKDTPYQKLLTALITGMVNHKAPDGYFYHVVRHARHFNFYGIGVMALRGVYNGARLKGMVFTLRNKTRHAITVKEAWFYQHGVAAIALSKQTLLPKETALVFDVVNKMRRS